MTIFRTVFFTVVTFICFTSLVLPATYYVDNLNGNDSRSGTSPAYSWKTIAKVNSRTLYPGDAVLFVRGGIWKETLTIKNNGTSTQPITFGSYGTGNLPVFDGSNIRANCIYMTGRSNIIVKEIMMTNTSTAGGSGGIRIKYSTNVIVRDCQFYVTGRAGIFIEQSSSCKAINNKISTPSTYYAVQTDGIYVQRNSNNTYDGNHIVISNQHADQHCDAIQLYSETSATVCNNYIEQNNTKGGNAQGIYAESPSGTFRIFNNVCYGLYTTSGLIKFKNYSTTGTAQVIGNTIYGGKSQLFVTNDPNIVFKNNIIQTTSASAPVRFETVVSNKSNINYNVYKRSNSGGTLIIYAGSGSSSYKTMSQWKAMGFDLQGIEADPQFNNPSARDLTIKSSSPALDKGIVLSAPYNLDKLGNLRPAGKSSDMGAFEIVGLGKTGEDEPETKDNIKSPGEFELGQNYPNPFNPSTRIQFTILATEETSLTVYDILGNEIAELYSGILTAGSHEFNFDGSQAASGTYIYVLRTKNFMESRKMVLIK